MKDVHVTIYTKEKGRLELSREEWIELDNASIAFHREDGPAIEWSDGNKEWFINDKRHRIDGPAIEWSGGDRAWHIDSEYYIASQYNQIIEEAKALPLELRLTDPRWWVRELK